MICMHHTKDGLWLCEGCLDARPEAVDTDDVKNVFELQDSGLSAPCDHCGRDIVADRTVDDVLADINGLLAEVASWKRPKAMATADRRDES